MPTGRRAGDRLRGRRGSRRLLTYAGLATAAAVTIVVLAPAANVALLGFFLTGLAICTVIPTTISVAGTVAPGRGPGRRPRPADRGRRPLRADAPPGGVPRRPRDRAGDRDPRGLSQANHSGGAAAARRAPPAG